MVSDKLVTMQCSSDTFTCLLRAFDCRSLGVRAYPFDCIARILTYGHRHAGLHIGKRKSRLQVRSCKL